VEKTATRTKGQRKTSTGTKRRKEKTITGNYVEMNKRQQGTKHQNGKKLNINIVEWKKRWAGQKVE
jgi:hypothetical protein